VSSLLWLAEGCFCCFILHYPDLQQVVIECHRPHHQGPSPSPDSVFPSDHFPNTVACFLFGSTTETGGHACQRSHPSSSSDIPSICCTVSISSHRVTACIIIVFIGRAASVFFHRLLFKLPLQFLEHLLIQRRPLHWWEQCNIVQFLLVYLEWWKHFK